MVYFEMQTVLLTGLVAEGLHLLCCHLMKILVLTWCRQWRTLSYCSEWTGTALKHFCARNMQMVFCKISANPALLPKAAMKFDTFLHEIGRALLITQCQQLSLCCTLEVTRIYYGII